VHAEEYAFVDDGHSGPGMTFKVEITGNAILAHWRASKDRR